MRLWRSPICPKLYLCHVIILRTRRNGYYPPVDHIEGYDNGSLWTTNFTVGPFAYGDDAGIDGLTWIRTDKPVIQQDYVYRPNLRHAMAPDNPSVGIISIGSDASTIADDYGPVGGITIKAQKGTPIYFNDWDLTYKPDEHLVNCESLGGTNTYGLPCTKGIEHCKSRAEKAKKLKLEELSIAITIWTTVNRTIIPPQIHPHLAVALIQHMPTKTAMIRVQRVAHGAAVNLGFQIRGWMRSSESRSN